MKILILSAHAGQGHLSCAKAIGEACAAHGDVCVIEDVFALLSKKLSDAIAKSHEKSYCSSPERSDASYRFLVRHPELFARKRLVYRVMSLGRRPIRRCIREGGYDTVICTHALAAMMLTAAMEDASVHVRSAFVATDHTCSPGVNGTVLDRYFVPHPAQIEEFTAAGIPPEKIIPSGIPVQKAFSGSVSKAVLKAEFGLQPGKRHLLLMCGSMGCGPIPALLRSIAAARPDGWEITVVCGTNDTLRSELQSEHAADASIHIRGYESRMPALLASADLYLTKPGGLSTAEASAAAIPMVLVDAVAGCEQSNLQHFVQQGAAVTGDTVEDIVSVCLALMRSPEAIDAMALRLRQQTPPDAAERIWQEMNALSAQPR